jgi:hypothetical protein
MMWIVPQSNEFLFNMDHAESMRIVAADKDMWSIEAWYSYGTETLYTGTYEDCLDVLERISEKLGTYRVY